jgi:hypothetical protein
VTFDFTMAAPAVVLGDLEPALVVVVATGLVVVATGFGLVVVVEAANPAVDVVLVCPVVVVVAPGSVEPVGVVVTVAEVGSDEAGGLPATPISTTPMMKATATTAMALPSATWLGVPWGSPSPGPFPPGPTGLLTVSACQSGCPCARHPP